MRRVVCGVGRGRESSPLWYARGLSDIFPSSCLLAVDCIREGTARNKNCAPHVYYYFNIPANGFCHHKKKTVVFCIVRDEMIEFRAVPSPLFPKAVFAGARVWLVTVIGFRTRPLDGRFTRTYVGGTRIGIRSRVNQNVSGPAGEKNIFTFVPRRRFDVRLVETLK